MSISKRPQIPRLAAVCLSGIGVGWLTGVSASPVVAVLLASVLAVATSVVTTLSGIEVSADGEPHQTKPRPDPWPIAVLILSVVCGSLIGIRARVNEWLGQSPAEIERKWQTAGLSLTTEDIVKRLFEEEHGSEQRLPSAKLSTEPKAGSEPADKMGKEDRSARNIRPDKPYLFAADQKLCDTLRAKEGSDLRWEMQHSGIKQVEEFAARVRDSIILKAAVETLVCPK
jgi:hypothetical protein